MSGDLATLSAYCIAFIDERADAAWLDEIAHAAWRVPSSSKRMRGQRLPLFEQLFSQDRMVKRTLAVRLRFQTDIVPEDARNPRFQLRFLGEMQPGTDTFAFGAFTKEECEHQLRRFLNREIKEVAFALTRVR